MAALVEGPEVFIYMTDKSLIENLSWVPYGDTGRFTHMMGGDIPTWRAFIRDHSAAFDEVVYDLHVGSGANIQFTRDPNVLAWGKSLTQLRIDVLARHAGNLTIVEVRRLPGVSSIGQLIAYQSLFVRDYKPARNPALVLVSEFITPDIEYIAREMGILTMTVKIREV